MIDEFAERVITELKGITDVNEAKTVAKAILDDGDFQSNVPALKDAVDEQTTTDGILLVMWRTANSGVNKKARYGNF